MENKMKNNFKEKAIQCGAIIVLAQIIVIVLKLTGVISYWSWWSVFYPIWMVIGLLVLTFVLAVIWTVIDLIRYKGKLPIK
jgi:membrane protein YdbS with pleckstrin-like domain